MKKIILTVSILLAFSVTSFAWATKNEYSATDRTGIEVFFSDFSEDTSGEAPNGFDVVNYGGKVYVEASDNGKGEVKNMLVLSDTMNPSSSDWSGPSTTKKLTPLKGIISFEVRFKTEKTKSDIHPVSFNIRNGNDSACTVAVDASDGILSYTYGPSLSVELAGTGKWQDGEWVTVRVTLDLKEQMAGVEVWADCLVNSDTQFIPSAKYEPSKGKLTYGNLPLNASFSHDSISELKISMSRYEGISTVDYISVYKNAKMPEGKKNISAVSPKFELPEKVPSGKYVNLYYNNEYHYFPAKTLNINSSTYCSVDDLCDIFGFSYENEDESIIINADKKIILSKDKTKESFGISFVPVRFVLESAGFEIGWISETSTITAKEV